MNEVAKFFQEHISLILTVISIGFIMININAIIRQNAVAIKSERNERFKNAIEQLGSDKNTLVLGGIYTLHRIAKEDKSYRENVFNILCAFVRETTTADDYQESYKEKPSEAIQAILNILCVNKVDWEVYRTPKGKLIINFAGAYLKKANLSYANLYRATLTKANLTEADLVHADLNEAYLDYAYLAGASLENAELSWACLSNANLSGAFLWDANFANADLGVANLTGAILCFADFSSANLNSTNLKGVYSSEDIYYKIFEEQIEFRMGKDTVLSGIEGGYDAENPSFSGEPIFGAYTKEEADGIIKEYNE